MQHPTIQEASQQIRAGEISPVALTESCLARIEQLNPTLDAFITVTAESALEEARQAEAEIRAGKYRGPLHGIPLALKDLVDTAGVRTTAASHLFEKRVPAEDAFIVKRLKAAGAILLGKLNLHEFAYGGSGIIGAFGIMRNPWDTERITGGSSSGSAAARCCGTLSGRDWHRYCRIHPAPISFLWHLRIQTDFWSGQRTRCRTTGAFLRPCRSHGENRGRLRADARCDRCVRFMGSKQQHGPAQRLCAGANRKDAQAAAWEFPINSSSTIWIPKSPQPSTRRRESRRKSWPTSSASRFPSTPIVPSTSTRHINITRSICRDRLTSTNRKRCAGSWRARMSQQRNIRRKKQHYSTYDKKQRESSMKSI